MTSSLSLPFVVVIVIVVVVDKIRRHRRRRHHHDPKGQLPPSLRRPHRHRHRPRRHHLRPRLVLRLHWHGVLNLSTSSA
jgi:hypothetical protein